MPHVGRGFGLILGAVVVQLLFFTRAASSVPHRPAQWSRDIALIASDKNEGRLTGTKGHLRAANYVEERFREIGLKPAGLGGTFRQPVSFEEQTLDPAHSSAWLAVGDYNMLPLKIGRDLIVNTRGARLPQGLDAPLTFVGYGLHIPGRGYDDFAGIDLRGKIAVVISGGPPFLSGPEKAAARSQRARFLAEAGAVGQLSLTTPKQVEIPWPRVMALASQPGMYLADPKLRDTPAGYQSAILDPSLAEQIFAGSGRKFAELADLADRSSKLPHFALNARLSTRLATSHRTLTSPNLMAVLEGSDPRLKHEYVVISAHLDHLGIGQPIGGDRIYNGAMDNASGVASILDIARQLALGPRPRRSVLFVATTAEEKGLLGSYYFVNHPTTGPGSIVADLNIDMPLPLWKLTSVMVEGDEESSLGDVARTIAAAQKLRTVPDPLPDQNVFIRNDEFSFARSGVPAVTFRFGFEKDRPEFQIQHDFFANRYHAPSDDPQQPGVLNGEAIKLDDYISAIARRVADSSERPSWNPHSFLRPRGSRRRSGH
jgi:Zn-dependent M28 family amino/carboxypeptidase